jgi:hypothetical protein
LSHNPYTLPLDYIVCLPYYPLPPLSLLALLDYYQGLN